MACGGCGNKTKFARVISTMNGGAVMQVNVPGVGAVDAESAIAVTYTGSQQSTITKLGVAGTVYKFSANVNGTFGPEFTAFAKDAHLFAGPFTFATIPVEAQESVQPAVAEPQPVFEQSVESEPEVLAVQTAPEETDYEPDDLTEIKHIGPAGQRKLNEAGMQYFEDVADASVGKLVEVLGYTEAKVKEVQASANALLEALE